MRLALWTPGARSPGAGLVRALEAAATLVVVAAEPARRPEVDLDVYHVADDPAFGFVYRALLARPGVVWLEAWNLHSLVHAETAGRGDAERYLREARRAHGPAGAFVAGQVLRGRGGALISLLELPDRVLESALAVVTTQEDVRDRSRGRVDVPVVLLPANEDEAADAAARLLELARGLVSRLPEAARSLRQRREQERRPLGRALDELRPFARELGLRGVPAEVARLIAGLLGDSTRP